MSVHLTDQDQFRDHISTADQRGKRLWIYPQKPSGRFYNYRKYLSYFFLLIFFGLPFLKCDGEPLFLFNVIEGKFIFFGTLFLPQDFPLFGLAMLTFMVFIVLFTAIFGRLFCGWICPQTIFMEMVFRRIEYWIDGDANEQRRLKNRAWDAEKTGKRVFKYSIFFIISFLIANMFLSYILGIDELGKIIVQPITMHKGLFFGLLFFSLVFFFVYTYVRENVCILICPYGRLQGVLLDNKSIVVAYDYVRGEPRGKLSKESKAESLSDSRETGLASSAKGDCIDCGLCVKVCPTGIDIRNGTQLECINCTACNDACDEIMDKIHKPRGLVRYASELNIREKKPFRFTARMIGYTVVLLLLSGTFLRLFMNRSAVDGTFLRTPGIMYQKIDSQNISNLYNVKILNKSHFALGFDLKVEGEPDARIQMIGNHALHAEKGDYAVGEVFIIMPLSALHKRNTELKIGIYAAGKKMKEIKTNFIGPG